MSSSDNPAATSKDGVASRVSLACIPCRSRHVRCDAVRPICGRCAFEGKECSYAKSRRGGLNRAALAALAGRRAGVTNGRSTSATGTGTRGMVDGASGISGPENGRWQESNMLSPTHADDGGGERPQPELPSSFGLRGVSAWPRRMPGNPPIDFVSVANDPFLHLYYRHFHRYHPCVLPKAHLQRTFADTTTHQSALMPLIHTLRFIGSIYGLSDQALQLREQARQSIMQTSTDPSPNPFLAQCRLLFSIALYWSADKTEARLEIDAAIHIALELGMHRRQFAAEYGRCDPVLQESWRRTWWQIYLVDAYYAAIYRQHTFPTFHIDATTDLPCEEAAYESGEIPYNPKSLEDFDSREFAIEEHIYSSFAYLVGAARAMSSAIASAMPATASDFSSAGLEAANAIINGYLLLLPESKQAVMKETGEADDLMFQAHMAVYTTIIGVHRPFSDLIFNPLESISSCPTGPSELRLSGDPANVPTLRCLRAIEEQVRLLALPKRRFCNTPFVVCMIVTGAIPLLSACKFLFTTEKRKVARHQIRMIIGCLKGLADIWPQGANNLREVRMIAQEVLGLRPGPSPGTEQTSVPRIGNSFTGLNMGVNNDSAADDDQDVVVSPNETGEMTLPMLDDLEVHWDLTDLDCSVWYPRQ